MGLLNAHKIKKSLAVLLASQDSTSPQPAQALSQLKAIGRPALAKCVEALGRGKHPERIEELLTVFLDNETFPFFVPHLAHPNPQVATGIANVFVKGTKYDPDRLLTLFADGKIPKAALGRILAQRQDHLPLTSLLALLGTADRDSRAVLFRLIEQSATEAMLPELMRATRSEDPTMRESMARTLARFRTAAVRETLVGLLNDQHKAVRQAALAGLASLPIPLDVGPICQMLRDPEPSVRIQAQDILIQVSDEQMMPSLIDLLQDAAEEVRQRAVDVLNAVRDSALIRALLHALRDEEWWVQVRVFEALRSAGEAKLFDAVLALLKDEDAYIRSSASEIVKKDHRAFNYLVATLEDPDAGVRARTVQALVPLEDQRAVPVFLRLLHETPEVGTLVIPALAELGNRQAIPLLVECLHEANQALCQAALRALATLTDAAHAAQVFQAVRAVRDTADTELKAVANSTASALIDKFGGTAGVPGRLGSDSHALVAMVTDDHDTATYIDADTLAPDARLDNRYRVIRRVGKGGFGSVVLVEDTVVGEEIILKFLHRDVASDEHRIKRFKHELLYARRITHENVIRIHEFLRLGQSSAISMEYFPSHRLSDELKHGALGMQRGLKIIWDICRGMGAAHQVGVVHRDLKPANILINDSGLVKVVDFGLAAVNRADSRLTKTGMLVGTPTYMAPEQIRARTIDARTDIYSLGVTMYEMFTGKPPYVADDPMAILFQHVEGNPTPPRQLKPDMPLELEAIILKAMCVDPGKRFRSMDDVRRSIVDLSKRTANRLRKKKVYHDLGDPMSAIKGGTDHVTVS